MDLPEEIKLLIALAVDNKSLTKCRQTCKNWLAALTPLCFKRLPVLRNLIFYKDEHLQYLINILQYVKDESISLQFFNGRFSKSVHLLGTIKNLQELTLDHCLLDDTFLEPLALCTNLTSLKVMIGSKSGMAYNLDHLEGLSNITSLRNLELSGYLWYHLDENAPIDLLQRLTKLPYLESIPNIPIMNDEHMDVIYYSPLKTRLKAIYLEGQFVSHNMIQKLIEMTNLTRLRLSSADELEDMSFSLLGSLCNLCHVCFEYLERITDQGLTAAKKWTNLETCRFQFNSDYSFISNTTSIKSLDINQCVMEGGLRSISKLTNLEELRLGSVDGLSAMDFLDVPLNNLTRLQVSLHHIYYPEIEQHLDMTKVHPKLKENMYEAYSSSVSV